PKFDVTTDAGQAIIGLFNGIKANIESSDGGWNGGDVVDALNDWFAALGIDVDGPRIDTPVE
ncbi:hypothetical protein HTV80_33630, partial [Streptomyces sp. Vc74B-19]|nr:hypothetical protein [Streptomyces sp. Vc74B-19]